MMRPADDRKVLSLRIFGCTVQINCCDAGVYALLTANHGQMQSRKSGVPRLEYTISRRCEPSGFCIARWGGESLTAADDGELLFLLEKELTIELQKLRRDLYFLHAGALECCGRALLLVAPSGSGKSTTTWGLLHHGFRYLSDELAALDLDTLEVQPYAHAICLKRNPPAPYFLPDQAVRTASTVHIPMSQLPSGVTAEPTRVAVIFFLDYNSGRHTPALRQLSSAEAAARLFANALNPLAHPDEGLAGAARIAQTIPSFHLTSGELRLTCELMRRNFEGVAARRGLRGEFNPAMLGYE